MAHILVVDDLPPDRLYVRSLLVKCGHDVVEAADGERALELVRDQPDVILLDLVMPNMDGFETLVALKADPTVAHIPVLLMTSSDSGDEAARGLRLGAHDFLRKPVAQADLIARVGAAVRVAQLLEELRSTNSDLKNFGDHAAHDLKSPLSVIRFYAEHALGRIGPVSSEQVTGALEAIIDGVDRATSLIDDLLALSRQETESLANLCTDPCCTVKDALGAVNLADADVDVQGSWAPLDISEPAFAAIMRNLIENASHYGRDEAGQLTLSILSELDNDHAVITLDDAGAGIDPGDAELLFAPFQRGVKALDSNPASTGVGLAIVRRSLQRRGGGVMVRKGSRGGAAFVLTVPLAARLSEAG